MYVWHGFPRGIRAVTIAQCRAGAPGQCTNGSSATGTAYAVRGLFNEVEFIAVQDITIYRRRSQWWDAENHSRNNFDETLKSITRGRPMRRTSVRDLTSATDSSPLSRSWPTCQPKNDTYSALSRTGFWWMSFSGGLHLSTTRPSLLVAAQWNT